MTEILKLKKKIIYRSNYRGCKETDLIIGSFAKIHTSKMPLQDLKRFLEILDESDDLLYKWITKKAPLPNKYKSSKVFKQIIEHTSKFLNE